MTAPRHRRRLWWSFALVAGFLVVQLAAGLLTGSLALLSDAGHMATDVVGLVMALGALTLASRPARSPQHTFGWYRLEVLAALANALLLAAMAAYVLVEAVGRLSDPHQVAAVPVLVVGVLGLGVNLVGVVLLHDGATENLNLRGAYAEVLADALGSVGVIVAAATMWATGWTWVDPVIGVGIGLFVLPRAWRLGVDATRVLLQTAPRDVDVPAVSAALVGLDGVDEVHDVHLWTLTSGMEVLSAHVTVDPTVDPSSVPARARRLLDEQFHLTHVTVQVEQGGELSCGSCR